MLDCRRTDTNMIEVQKSDHKISADISGYKTCESVFWSSRQLSHFFPPKKPAVSDPSGRPAASDPSGRPAAAVYINVFNFDNELNYLLRLAEISVKKTKQRILKSFLISSQSFKTDILQNKHFSMPLKFIDSKLVWFLQVCSALLSAKLLSKCKI